MTAKKSNLRSQLKATSIDKLKERVNEDNVIIGATGQNEYLNLEDGKTLKIRIFPAHPGGEDFYVPKKCYWLTVPGNDGNARRTTVIDSKVHGGTKYDLIEEYVKMAKKACSKSPDKLEALVGTGMQSNSLNPQYSWLCYADVVSGDNQLKPKLWEFKKMVRDCLNKLAFSEDEDDAIEVDPFTDVDEGLPVMVKYLKRPNKKKGENYYDVTFPKRVSPRVLTDEEVEHFMTLKPLSEVIYNYDMRDFERALEGLQYFDDENEIGLFDDEAWLELVETIKSQYDADDSDDDDDKPAKKSKKTTRKVVKKEVVEDDEDEDDEDEEEEEKPAPKKKATKKPAKKAKPAPKPVVVEEDEEEEEEEDEEEEDDEEVDVLAGLDRNGLKKHIRTNKLEVKVKKSMSDDDICEAIRVAMKALEEDDEEEDDEEEDEPRAKVSLSDIKRKLAGK